jgi:hypothetical protein
VDDAREEHGRERRDHTRRGVEGWQRTAHLTPRGGAGVAWA